MTEDRGGVSATLSTEAASHSERGTELVVIDRRGLAHHPVLSAARSVSVGRSGDCDIVLDDPAASRRHAVVHVGDVLSIEDLNSRNGTRLRGTPLAPRQRVPLRVGDSVQIGGAMLLVQHSARVPDRRHGNSVAACRCGLEAIVPADGTMRAVHELVERVAPTTVTVLILGETGVGKELVAEAIHRASPRRAGPLVRINCAALPGALLESELFGHERGAFTGAAAGKPGLLEAAEGGTAFLDEIGELPLAAQPKLLRVLEAREVMRLGSLRARPIDIRFIAATNRDLPAEVARGTFREDLYFRLNVVSIAVPPLRERMADIEALARHFVEVFCQHLERPAPTLEATALRRLRSHHWPGNVRELRNVVEWAVLHTAGSAIEVHHLPPTLGDSSLGAIVFGGTTRVGASAAGTEPPPCPWTDAQQAERLRIVDALAACNGNQTRAAEWLNMPRRTLVAKLATYRIPRPRMPSR